MEMIKIVGEPPRPKYLIENRIRFIETILLPLLVFGACGFIAVLVDFDHFTEIIFNGLAITRSNLTGRTVHIPYFIFIGTVWVYSLTHFYRLVNVVLKDYFGDD